MKNIVGTPGNEIAFLKNLETEVRGERQFKQTHVEVFQSGPPSLIEVRWEFEPSVIPLSRYKIDIFRGESSQDMERIAKDLPAELYSVYEDRSAKLRDNHRTYHYRIVAKNKITGRQIKSEVQTWDGDLDYVGLYVVTEHNFKFRYVSGTPLFIYKKHTDGSTKCPDCWDFIAKRVKKSNCKTCHGTGNIGKGVGGYFNPTYTWADLNPDAEIVQITQWGRAEPTQTDILMTNYPRMTVGDLLIELKTNKRWEVLQVQDTEKRRTKMLQIVRVKLLDKSAIEYTIDVPNDIKDKAKRELDATKQIPEF